ncbi:MAG: Uma2 family endonuclease [Isosphaeraceae bacterium]
MTLAPPIALPETVAELLERLGDIPPGRVRLVPTPGTATEADVLHYLDRENRLFELVDGTLVEKAMGFDESLLAGLILSSINQFLFENDLGIAAGADGTLKLTTGQVRIPDVTFVSWASLPGGERPAGPIPQLPVDLAVEVLSQGNTRGEMERKVAEYLGAGTKLVWLIDPRKRAAWIHAPGLPVAELADGDSLDGGNVLPGFVLRPAPLFDRAARRRTLKVNFTRSGTGSALDLS